MSRLASLAKIKLRITKIGLSYGPMLSVLGYSETNKHAWHLVVENAFWKIFHGEQLICGIRDGDKFDPTNEDPIWGILEGALVTQAYLSEDILTVELEHNYSIRVYPKKMDDEIGRLAMWMIFYNEELLIECSKVNGEVRIMFLPDDDE